tara:strand:+ start:1165 stop:2277 length:1113 start_codon:yes stop_codon:yes gene_type:complete
VSLKAIRREEENRVADSEKILVNKTNLDSTKRVSTPVGETLGEGEILLKVERFALTTNNITYAFAGAGLGYWNFYPEPDPWGCVPVWGFATVIESQCAEITVGDQVFGFLPTASHLVLKPAKIDDVAFFDSTDHRADLFTWYNRYFRCAADPVFTKDSADVQPVLWPLFMTGWMLAEKIGNAADTIYISSASSKTALSIAWSVKHQKCEARSIGLTSKGNKGFVEGLGIYDEVQTYDDLKIDPALKSAIFVNVAGNGALCSEIHVALGDRLIESVALGATHRAPDDGTLPMPGPAPELFFIPTIAEDRAAEEGFATTHQKFADAWHAFTPWASRWLELQLAHGVEGIEASYRCVLDAKVAPQQAIICSWA